MPPPTPTRGEPVRARPSARLALLRLAQGDVDGAVRAATRMLDEHGIGTARSGLLAAAVEVRLATGDPTAGRELADELASLAEVTGTEMLVAWAAYARGPSPGLGRRTVGDCLAACCLRGVARLRGAVEVARTRFQLGLA